MSLAASAPERVIPSAVLGHCQRHHLLDYLRLALRLAEQNFQPLRDLRVGVEVDPETDEEAVIIDVSVELEVDEALLRKRQYTHQWVTSIPPQVIGRIRLLLDIP